MFSKCNRIFFWNFAGMLVMGTMLKAYLISEVDEKCIDSPQAQDKEMCPMFYGCHGYGNQLFSLNESDGKICRKQGVCLASRNNSDQEQAEIVQKPVENEKGGLWKFTNGNVINGFGLCLERGLDNAPSRTFQAKCDSANLYQKFRFDVFRYQDPQ